MRLPAIGPFREDFWRSPLRGPWLASVLSSALLPLIAVCAVTGFVSHWAYQPHLGSNAVFGGSAPGNGFDLYGLEWPTSPAWLYGATQGLHVISGLAAIPILLAKLWAVIPKLFENPPFLSAAHALERLSLVLLVGGSLFVLSTGVINIQVWYPFGFSFVPAHYYGAIVMLAALCLHVGLKLPVMGAAFRQRGVTRPLREDLRHTGPEPGLPGVVTSAPLRSAAPTLTRRALLGGVGAASAGLALMTTGQVVGGPLTDLAVLAPRGRGRGGGPNEFPVNKTFAVANIPREKVGPDWRLVLGAGDERRAVLSREELLAMDQVTAELPIACVEGWSTTQTWTGVRLAELARVAGVRAPGTVDVRSMQPRGTLRSVTLGRGQVTHPEAILALRVNGADLSLDHGYPARVIVPALPGVHCTKWVGKMVFG
jgi:DMSO/TMAO reductase YedYZ molybdopterin-dependent catalytic subunit